MSQVTDCHVAGQLVLCCRSRLAASQVMACSAAGRLFYVGPATLYALQQRFPSLVPSKESDLRHQGGRPATLCVSPPSSLSPFLRSRAPLPASQLLAPAPRALALPPSPSSSPLPHPRKRFRNPTQYFNILTLVFWWQSIYICDI